MITRTLTAMAVFFGGVFGETAVRELEKRCKDHSSLNTDIEFPTKFEEKDFINEGSFGKVYNFKVNGKEFALKVIPLGKEKEKNTKKILSEVNNLIELGKIDGISKMHYCEVKNDNFYLLMDKFYKHLYDDEVIKNFAQKSFLQVLTIVQKTAKTLHEIHEKGFSHGDVKSDNLMFETDKLEKIGFIDFGSAKKTKNNCICGNEIFLPPEVVFKLGFEEKKTTIGVWESFSAFYYSERDSSQDLAMLITCLKS
jgi:serine/threonine protein kinase